jgi:hypothetical protein
MRFRRRRLQDLAEKRPRQSASIHTAAAANPQRFSKLTFECLARQPLRKCFVKMTFARFMHPASRPSSRTISLFGEGGFVSHCTQRRRTPRMADAAAQVSAFERHGNAIYYGGASSKKLERFGDGNQNSRVLSAPIT